MSDPWTFEFNTEKLEKSFSSLQPVSDSVQAAESPSPGCCTRTSLVLACRPFERGYRLELPLKTRHANESPDKPPQNGRLHVMAAQVKPPVLQVLSVHDGKDVAEIQVTAQGPAQCPPGKPNLLKVDGVGGGEQGVPFNQWAWKVPALLDAALIGELTEDMISLLHPFKSPALPAQIWQLSLPGCGASRLHASVAAFPDVRWQGRLVMQAQPQSDTAAGFETILSGNLGCHYNGREFQIRLKSQAKALCGWLDAVEMLARCAVALLALKPAARQAGLDNPRLQKEAELSLNPWPQIMLQMESSLFEQEGNGLLGHALKAVVSGSPLMGAAGEVSLLPSWLEDPARKPFLAPLLAGLDVVRVEEIAQELGLWLVAEGQASIRAGVETRRPLTATQAMGKAAGGIRLSLQPRSIRDYDAMLTCCGGAQDATASAGLKVACEAPPDSPLPEPRDKKCRALLNFTGCAVSSIEKWRPGCRFRRWQPPGAKPPPALLLVPGRAWPAGGEAGELPEIPWCD